MHILSCYVSSSRCWVWPGGVDGYASSCCTSACHLFYFLTKKHLQLLGLIIAVTRIWSIAGATLISWWPLISCSRISVTQCTTRLLQNVFFAPPSLWACVILKKSLAFLKVRHSISSLWSPLNFFGIALNAISPADSQWTLPSWRPRSRISDRVIGIPNLKRVCLLLPHLPHRYFIRNIKRFDSISFALRCHIHHPIGSTRLILLRIKHIFMYPI